MSETPYRQRRRPRGGVIGWLGDQFSARPKPVWMVVTADILMIGIALVVFALFHHVLPRNKVSAGIRSTRVAASAAPVMTAAPETAIEPAETVEPTSEVAVIDAAVGDFSEINAGRFSDGEIKWSDDGYISPNVNIAITSGEAFESNYYVADIYIKDISCFQTSMAKDRFGNHREWPVDMAERFSALLALSGDNYGSRDDGIVIRNGELFQTEEAPLRDVCVLYWNGVMETLNPWEFDTDTVMANGAYQAWNFGPALLDGNGAPLTSFNSDVGKENPRSVVGYFEPGHYCFVAVDGRSSASRGMTMAELAQFMQGLGCQAAYNLDGGNTAMMYFKDKVISTPSGGGRKCSDLLMIVEPS